MATIAEPHRIGEVRDAVDLLTDTLLSCLSYVEGGLIAHHH
ncbi:hypothetical protein [Lentzea sp. CC55]|nr:hypothetical protein [Lentzea sp. CC55]